MTSITIGVCAYNEEKNIGKLLGSLLDQMVNGTCIREIIVVSSACTDKTDEIVNKFTLKDKRIRHIIQEERKGKASAVNIILKNAVSDIIVLASADILITDSTIDKLIVPFSDEIIGMTGGHPIPVDDKNTFIGHAVHLVWELHHELALKRPKLGEIIAFRNIVDKIPSDTAVDEASIEAIIRDKGLELCYVPEAIVYNKGASTIEDFIVQRRRIFAGHLHLKNNNGYAPSSMSTFNTVNLVFKNTPLSLKLMCWTVGAMCLESYARLLAMHDYMTKKNPYIWKMANTTKEVKVNKDKEVEVKEIKRRINGRQGI